MSLIIGENFKYQGKLSNFDRDSFKTLEKMKNFPDTSLDDGHVSFCEETGLHYKFKRNNPVDETLGKWRVYVKIDAEDTKDIITDIEENLHNVVLRKTQQDLTQEEITQVKDNLDINDVEISETEPENPDADVWIQMTPDETPTPHFPDILQVPGKSKIDVMSQEAITEALKPISDKDSSNGMARVNLPENIKIVDGKRTSILTQTMMPLDEGKNTIYVIQYNYDLQGATIEVPEGCILDFQGGSLNNGTLKGNNTDIKAALDFIFKNSLTLNGSWKNNCCYVEWFGGSLFGEIDDRNSIQRALNSPIQNIELLPKSYTISTSTKYDNKQIGLFINKPKKIYGTNIDGYSTNSIILCSENNSLDSILYLDSSNINITNIRLIGSSKTKNGISTNFEKSLGGFILTQVYVKNVLDYGFSINGFLSSIYLCRASYCSVGFYLHRSNISANTSCEIKKCYSIHCRKYGYHIYYIGYTSIIECAADRCGFNEDNINDGEIYHPYFIDECSGFTMQNCGVESSYKTIKISGSSLGSVNNCLFLNYSNEYPDLYNHSEDMLLGWCDVTFNRCSLGFFPELSAKVITVNNNTNAVFNDCGVKNYPKTTLIKLNQTMVLSKDEGAPLYGGVSIINNRGNNIINGGFTGTVSDKYNYTRINGDVIVKLKYPGLENIIFTNIIGNLSFIPEDGIERIQSYVSGKNIFENCTNITFNKIQLIFQKVLENDDYCFHIKNSHIKFNTVEFFTSPKNNKMFNITDSVVIFENWNFKSTYGTSDDLSDYIRNNNSTILLKNGNNIRYITSNGSMNLDGTDCKKVTIL